MPPKRKTRAQSAAEPNDSIQEPKVKKSRTTRSSTNKAKATEPTKGEQINEITKETANEEKESKILKEEPEKVEEETKSDLGQNENLATNQNEEPKVEQESAEENRNSKQEPVDGKDQPELDQPINSTKRPNSDPNPSPNEPPSKKPKQATVAENGKQKQPPNYTILAKNLNDKIPGSKMKQNLYILFTTYGDVISINYTNKGKLRGQAWVILSSVDEAKLAIGNLQGEVIFGKKLVLEFSSSKSKVIEQLEKLGANNELEIEASV